MINFFFITESHVNKLAYPLSFFKYHGTSQKLGNLLYICTVKGCKRDKPLSTVDNSRGNLHAHVKVSIKRKLNSLYAFVNPRNIILSIFKLSLYKRRSFRNSIQPAKTLILWRQWLQVYLSQPLTLPRTISWRIVRNKTEITNSTDN